MRLKYDIAGRGLEPNGIEIYSIYLGTNPRFENETFTVQFVNVYGEHGAASERNLISRKTFRPIVVVFFFSQS